MTSIEAFINMIAHSRKRTAVVFLDSPALLQKLRLGGLEIFDLSESFEGSPVISDDELFQLIKNVSNNKSLVILNLEIFLSIRYQEPRYLQYLLSKLCQTEPMKPIFFGFYSYILYEKFRNYYSANKTTELHYYEAQN